MTGLRSSFILAAVAVVLIQSSATAQGHGKGGGKDHGGNNAKAQGKSKGPKQPKSHPENNQVGKDRGHSADAHVARAATGPTKVAIHGNQEKSKGHGRKFIRTAPVSALPVTLRHYVMSRRPKDVIASGAVAHAFAHGRGNDFQIDDLRDRTRIVNRRGNVLVDLDDDGARNLGRWRVGVIDDNVRDGAPSFCRSGAGHPVWGREWCLEKGFGLGSYQNNWWGYSNNIGDFTLPRTGIASILSTTALQSLLGSTGFDRLALQAVSLGLLEPLTGRWVSQQTGPQILMVDSGTYPVAELVDSNRDFRLDDLLVALIPVVASRLQ
jgi:hypothetical protein